MADYILRNSEDPAVRVHVSPNGDGETYRVYMTGEEEKAARSVSLADVPAEISAMGIIHTHKVRWLRALLTMLPKDKAWAIDAGHLHAWSNARSSDAFISKAILESMAGASDDAAKAG